MNEEGGGDDIGITDLLSVLSEKGKRYERERERERACIRYSYRVFRRSEVCAPI